jgi:hypothetical protein
LEADVLVASGGRRQRLLRRRMKATEVRRKRSKE